LLPLLLLLLQHVQLLSFLLTTPISANACCILLLLLHSFCNLVLWLHVFVSGCSGVEVPAAPAYSMPRGCGLAGMTDCSATVVVFPLTTLA
jgi:hypothetical protein